MTADASIGEDVLLDRIASLVDKNLLQMEAGPGGGGGAGIRPGG